MRKLFAVLGTAAVLGGSVPVTLAAVNDSPAKSQEARSSWSKHAQQARSSWSKRVQVARSSWSKQA